MKHIADILTAARIAAAVAMLFVPPLSALFFVIYTAGGITDMTDGAVARKCGTAGAHGSRLDSIADLLFCSSALFRLLPVMWGSFPVFVLWAAAGVAGVKISAAVIGAVRFRRMAFLHTYANKLTGAAVFLLPYFHSLGCFTALCAAVCAIAILAAAEELACVLKMKEYDAEKRGIIWQRTE